MKIPPLPALAWRAIWRGVPLVVLGALLVRSAPAWPDDWDGLGFLASIDHFDMDKFAPHPPGYPVYVAMLKLAALVEHNRAAPMSAAMAVSILCAIGTMALAQSTGARLRDEITGLFMAASVALVPLAWRASTSVGSEACAMFFLALAGWAIVRKNGWIAGLALGLGLGARLSWAPMYLATFVVMARGTRLRALASLAIGVALWLVPFAIIVGPSHLFALERGHVIGHATQWGGTIVTEPGGARFAWLARSIFVDGLGIATDVFGFAIGTLFAIVLLVIVSTWRNAKPARVTAFVVLALPYTIWIFLFQNIHQQPRHALPLVVLMVAGIAYEATPPRRVRKIAAALLAAIALRSARDSSERHDIPPAAVQLRDFMAKQDPHAIVFGNASVRFFEGTPLEGRAKLAGSVGDVEIARGKLADPPDRVLITSELRGLEDETPPPPPIAVFCRPERIDRRMPCLTLYEIR